MPTIPATSLPHRRSKLGLLAAARTAALVFATVVPSQALLVTGTVRDLMTGQPVGGAKVEVLGTQGGSTTTASDGTFRLTGTSAGAHRATASTGSIERQGPWLRMDLPLSGKAQLRVLRLDGRILASTTADFSGGHALSRIEPSVWENGVAILQVEQGVRRFQQALVASPGRIPFGTATGPAARYLDPPNSVAVTKPGYRAGTFTLDNDTAEVVFAVIDSVVGLAKKAYLLNMGGGMADSLSVDPSVGLASADSFKIVWRKYDGPWDVRTIVHREFYGNSGGIVLHYPNLLGTYCEDCELAVYRNGRIDRYALADSVAPIAYGATYRFARTTPWDTLVVQTSEPVFIGDTAHRGLVSMTMDFPVPSGLPGIGSTNGKDLIYQMAPGTFTRPIGFLLGGIQDKFGNAYHSISRAFAVDFGIAPTRAIVHDRDHDGRADSLQIVVRTGPDAPVPHSMGVRWLGQWHHTDDLRWDSASRSWNGRLDPLLFGTQSGVDDSCSLDIGTGIRLFGAAVMDSLPPILVGARRFVSGSTTDTVILETSETVVVRGSNLAVFSLDSSGTPLASPTLLAYAVNAKRIALIVAASSIPTSPLWVRLGPDLQDARGASPAKESPWIRLK